MIDLYHNYRIICYNSTTVNNITYFTFQNFQRAIFLYFSEVFNYYLSLSLFCETSAPLFFQRKLRVTY